jgi:hypothetical protein
VKGIIRVPLVEQEMLTLSEHLSPPMGFSDVRVAQSSMFRVVFCPSKIEEILTIDLSFPDIETEMEIFDNISRTRLCLISV